MIHLLAVVGIASTDQLKYTVLYIAGTKPPLCCFTIRAKMDGGGKKECLNITLQALIAVASEQTKLYRARLNEY